MKKIFFRLLSIFLSITFALILVEFSLSKLNFSPILNQAYQRQDITWMEKNVELNSAGYRDKEYPEDKTPENLRIYALGDSYTYGWLVDNPKDTYTEILEYELNSKGLKTEVINAGSPGFSLPEMFNRFLNEGKHYYPDLVLVGINDDEANFSKTYQRPQDHDLNPFIKSLQIYQLTLGNFFRQNAEKANHDYVLNIYQDSNSPEWKKTTEQILKLKQETSKINAKLAIVLFPHIHPNRPNDTYDYKPYNEKFRQFAQDNNIILFDPLEDFINYPDKSKLVINPLDPHPTKEMNHLVASKILNQFDYEEFTKNRQPFVPVKNTANITPDNLDIGPFQSIKKITSNKPDYPWVYFETKYQNDIQNFPLKDKSFRNSNIYLDNLQTAKSFTHSALPGATILYHVYPKEKGKITIPKSIYNFEIIGLNHIYALEIREDGTVKGEYLSPASVTKNNDGFDIRFYSDTNFHVYRVNLKAAVKQADISPEGKIENTTKSYSLKVTQPEKSKTVILPFSNKVSSWGEFSGEDTKAYTYAFINGKLTKVKAIKVEMDKIILDFDVSIEKDQEIEFPVMAQYNLEPEETIEIQYE